MLELLSTCDPAVLALPDILHIGESLRNEKGRKKKEMRRGERGKRKETERKGSKGKKGKERKGNKAGQDGGERRTLHELQCLVRSTVSEVWWQMLGRQAKQEHRFFKTFPTSLRQIQHRP